MRQLSKSSLIVTALTILCLAAAPPSHAVELITNGGFETGDFTGWSVSDLAGGSGSFFIDDTDGLTPLSGLATVGPAGGTSYAVSDGLGPGTHALSQSFAVPGAASSVILSFDMFVNDWSGTGPLIDPSGLDHTGNANQHGRVDVLSSGASAFDTGAGVLQNFYLNVDPGPPANPYTAYSFNITGLVGSGGTFVLRFGEVDNQGAFNMGVDNVSVNFTPQQPPPPPGVIPEPTTLTLIGVGFVCLFAIYWRKEKSEFVAP